MKGELLDNNKKKNMNIRLEDEREKNKKLKKHHLLKFRHGRMQPYPDQTASSNRLYILCRSAEQIRSSYCHLLLQGTLLPLAASVAQLHHRSYQRLCMHESCQGFPEDSLWL